jgi:hypothetical protein
MYELELEKIEMEISGVKADTIEPRPMEGAFDPENDKVIDAIFWLRKNGIEIYGDSPTFRPRILKKELKQKFIGKKVRVLLDLIKSKNDKIYLINDQNRIVSQFPSKIFIEGEIIKMMTRTAHPPNNDKIIVWDIIVDCGLPILINNVGAGYKQGDWIHVDGWIEFRDMEYI